MLNRSLSLFSAPIIVHFLLSADLSIKELPPKTLAQKLFLHISIQELLGAVPNFIRRWPQHPCSPPPIWWQHIPMLNCPSTSYKLSAKWFFFEREAITSKTSKERDYGEETRRKNDSGKGYGYELLGRAYYKSNHLPESRPVDRLATTPARVTDFHINQPDPA